MSLTDLGEFRNDDLAIARMCLVVSGDFLLAGTIKFAFTRT